MNATPERLPDNDTYYMGISMAVREKANCTGNRMGLSSY
jgi:dCMP deaminase